MMAMIEPRLALTGMCKSFNGIQVLHSVDFRVAPGAIHALLGENGAGKSTLLNILSGVFRADQGSIAVDGRAVEIASPLAARAAGIAMIHQELQQIPVDRGAEHVPRPPLAPDGRAAGGPCGAGSSGPRCSGQP